MLPVRKPRTLWRSAGSLSSVGVADERIVRREVLAQRRRERRRASASRRSACRRRRAAARTGARRGGPSRSTSRSAIPRVRERRADRGAQPVDDRAPASPMSTPRRARADRDVLGDLGLEVRRREVDHLEDLVHERPDLHAGGHDGERHLGRRRRRRRATVSSTSSSSTTSGSSGSLATRASSWSAGGDVAERRAPPAPVDVADEVRRRQVRRSACAAAPSGAAAGAPSARR